MVVVDRVIGMISMSQWFECREDGVTETSIVLIVNINDCILRDKELRQILIGATHQWKEFVGLLMHWEKVCEHQPQIFPD